VRARVRCPRGPRRAASQVRPTSRRPSGSRRWHGRAREDRPRVRGRGRAVRRRAAALSRRIGAPPGSHAHPPWSPARRARVRACARLRRQVRARSRHGQLPQRVERPDHTGRTDMEVLHRQRLLPPIPVVRGPECLEIERRVGVGDDRGDRVLDARRIPRLVGERLKLRWFVEHGASLRHGDIRANCR
jgi:hypothetical protein